MNRNGQIRSSAETGSALIYVLWVSAAIAMVLAAAAGAVQSQLRLVGTERRAAEADMALRSALDIVAYDTALIGRGHLQSLPVTVTIDDVPIRVGLAQSHARLDINIADDRRWQVFLMSQGVTETRAVRLADRILDWRDLDDDPRDHGGEASLYRGSEIGNRAFRSVSELSRVAGVTEREVACWSEGLTVYGGTPAPEIGEAEFGAVITVDGVRAAFMATRERPDGRGSDEMSALALFGASPLRPFEWIAFGVDDPELLHCGSSEHTDQDPAG